MLYPYTCDKCDYDFDVEKMMADSGRDEYCPGCRNVARRVYTPTQLIGTAVQNAEYNPGLGCVVKNKKDQEEICKRKGVTEIGNDFTTAENNQKHYDKKRKEKREERWKRALDD